jgi:hypothetical protein
MCQTKSAWSPIKVAEERQIASKAKPAVRPEASSFARGLLSPPFELSIIHRRQSINQSSIVVLLSLFLANG